MFAKNALLAGGRTAFRYWRVQFTGLVQSSPAERIPLLDVRFSEDGGSTEIPPDMTSDSAPSPYVASAHDFANASTAAWKAFDSDASSFWVDDLDGAFNNDWIQLDTGSGTEKAFNWLRIKYRLANSSHGTPSGFNVLASDTGAFSGEEETVHSESGLSAYTDGQVVEYTW